MAHRQLRDGLAARARECEREGGRALAVPTDVTREEEVRELARRAVESFGRIDTWVNNHGVKPPRRGLQEPRKKLRRREGGAMMTPMESPRRITRALAARQVDGYLRRRRPGEAEEGPALVRRPAITISSASGIPAHEIARRIAAELGFEVFDRELLEAVERDTRLSRRIVEALDRGRRSALDAWIDGWIRLHRIIDPKSFHHIMSRLIRGVGIHGEAVILGRGSNFFLRQTDAFRVRLTAPAERMAEWLAAREPGPERSLLWAREEVAREDARKARFIRENFAEDIDDPRAYDALFNLRILEPDHAARLVLGAYREVCLAHPVPSTV